MHPLMPVVRKTRCYHGGLPSSMSLSDSVLRGIWPAVLIETRHGSIDFNVLASTVRHFTEAGVHGLYTGDTASEFYTMEYEEWNNLATVFRALCAEAGLP